MTWTELRADIARRLDESVDLIVSGDGMWSDDDLRFWANDGLKDIGQRLMVHRDEKSYDTVAGRAEYDMPSDMVKLYRLEYRQSNSYMVTLEYMQMLMFDDVRGVMRGNSGFPTAFSTWGYPGGGGKIILDRAPSESRTDGLRLYYYRLPRMIEAPSDPIDLPAGWERLVSHYVEWNARRKEARDNRWREAQQLYEAGLEEMRRVAVQHSDQPSFFSDGGYGRATAIFGSADDWY